MTEGKLTRVLLRFASGGVLAFLYLPLVILAILAFNDSRTQRWPPTGFTLRWFTEALGNPSLLSAVANSLIVGHTYQDVQSNVDTAQVLRVVTSSITNTTYGQFELRRVGNGSVTFDVRHERRDTNLPTFNYTSTRVGLTAAYSF